MITLLGVSLWLAPVTTVAIAQRWQDELGFGIAYLGVFFESFGVGLVAVAVVLGVLNSLDGLSARFVRFGRIGVAIVVGFVSVRRSRRPPATISGSRTPTRAGERSDIGGGCGPLGLYDDVAAGHHIPHG